PQAPVRAAAAGALGRVRPWDAVDPLLKALDDEDLAVRAAAVDSLNKIGGIRLQFAPAHPSRVERRKAIAKARQTMAMARPMYDEYEKTRK
ncbi:MAG TPA: HEAT repeat domain-containing protein, partial [Tepidisphaeraceae bacterium]|nr:HEAT repeat domain-containing protein [Tepidisphaeraceae bacterium]